MSSKLHYFGIRHHGPGSCKRLLAALERLQPQALLIEGPADCNELIAWLGKPEMQPPVSMLAYSADDASQNIYYPFANYSPEYQAAKWALDKKVELAFIDVPVSVQLAQMLETKTEAESEKPDNEQDEEQDDPEPPQLSSDEENELIPQEKIIYDPIGALAKLANYEDGEAWWNDLIEQNSDDDEEIFNNVELAMQSLRENVQGSENDILKRDLVREAYMRLEVAKTAKAIDGPIAIVCGAWHVPALREKHVAKDDRALVKTLPTKLAKSKVKVTWVPWTSTRLARTSGYSAGVTAPMWYEHIWQQRNNERALEHWLTHVARTFRVQGQTVSTASVIEAVRLSYGLAAVRSRPQPGFEEIREAVVACMCFGETLPWDQLESKLLLGDLVGQIPDDVPLAPLLEDLQKQQRACKLKPEALDRELSLDLRSDSGHTRSTLLHRLNILEVHWGRPDHTGGSRGTFRERWILAWQPEFSVSLIENLIYGSTIEQAANNKVCELLAGENELKLIADKVHVCLQAQLPKAADLGLHCLGERAAQTDDCLEVLTSLPPLIDIARYGTAREISNEQVTSLIDKLAMQVCIALPYTCRNINEEEAQRYRQAISAAQQALQLAELDDGVIEHWWEALNTLVEHQQVNHLIVGLSAHLLYQAEQIESEELQTLMQKMLSPALPAAEAAQFFEGFFAYAVDRLIYDSMLLEVVEQWLIQLEEESFVEFLPLFRRVFSSLDAMERKRLIDSVLDGRSRHQRGKVINQKTVELWPEHLNKLQRLFKGEKEWMN